MEGIKEQSKDELYQLWLQRYENPMSDKKNYVDWKTFMDKHLKQNKPLPTSNKTDEELFEQANLIIEKMMKRSNS